jgi:hypothetical protein
MDSVKEPDKWIYAESERFWKLAHKIEEKQLWAGYLSEQEHSIWRAALRGRGTWNAFLEGHGEPLETGDSQEVNGNVNGTTKEGDNGEKIGEKIADPVSTAFRARVMLFEASVRNLFPSRTADEFIAFDVDDELDNLEVEPVLEEKPKTRDIEEDNYDDEEEDEMTALIPVPEPSNQDGDSSLDNIGGPCMIPTNSRRVSSST